MRKQRVFISGAITNRENYKEHFDMAEKLLSDLGYIVINPTILPLGLTHREYMSICVALLDICDCIYLLKGWENSRGSCEEYEIAVETGKIILYEGV